MADGLNCRIKTRNSGDSENSYRNSKTFSMRSSCVPRTSSLAAITNCFERRGLRSAHDSRQSS